MSATVGIISVGDMGLGIARLLLANGFKVITNASDRSQATQDRARRNNVELVSTDADLCNAADYIFSIVPPRDAVATAERFVKASSGADFKPRANPLYFLDLNAISPRAAREIHDLFATRSSSVRFVDGGIIGYPPRLGNDGASWTKPSIPTSGPFRLPDAKPDGERLALTLGSNHINPTIGAASGLKMCFASLSKGYAALSIQSFTTAHSLGVLDELRSALNTQSPSSGTRSEQLLTSLPPKAYRWVHEMEYIADTFEADGGFQADESPFRGIARIFDFVAHGTELGKETTEDRKRGTTPDDVALLVAEGTSRRKVKTD